MKPTIALFLYDPKCSVQSGNGIIKALSNNYNFKIFGINELEDNFFDDVDIVAVPGGFGDASSFDRAFKYSGDRIKQFIADGGYYLGICMGAYWAGKHYFNILEGIDAVQYITQPNTDTRRPHAKNIKIEWLGKPMDMFWYDGCAFTGAGYYDTIAKYANDDPMAIIQNRIGLIGAHPESQEFWYDGYSWMRGKYHNGQHHQLLLEFVNKLMEQV
jgi:glutamine amidotransferase-like uncharacterized protein